jgi:VWFA-related protein
VLEGLSASDFEVLEDGRPQAIENFQFIRVPQNVPDVERRDPAGPADALRQVADPNNRVFVVYLDVDHTTVMGSHAAQQPIADFLTRTIGASDLFAVATPETSLRLTFGRRTETIADELRKYWAWGERDRLVRMPRTDMEMRLAQCLANAADSALELLLKVYREDRLFTSLEQLLTELRSLREARKNLLLISEGWTPEGRQTQLLALSKGAGPSAIGTLPSGRLGRVAEQTGSVDYSWCDGQFARLAAIDFEQRYRDLLREARRANVAFYPVDVGGLKASALGQASTKSSAEADEIDRVRRTGLQTLRELASATDGLAVVNTNDLTGAIRRISDSLAGYYLLGYAPTNQRADGRFRDIQVRVKRPGVEVSARPGYFAPSASDRAVITAASDAAGPVVDAGIAAALDALSRVREGGGLLVYAARRPDAIEVIVELDAVEAASGRWKDGGQVRVSARASGAEPVVVLGRIEANARSARVSVPLRSIKSADATQAIAIDARLSGPEGPATGVEVRAAVDGAVGEPLLFRATPSPRSVPRATADPRFARAERIHVELPLGAGAEATARLLDARGRPLPVMPSLAVTGAGAERLVAVDLVLSPLAEGAYVLEVATVGAGERRLLAFRVTR